MNDQELEAARRRVEDLQRPLSEKGEFYSQTAERALQIAEVSAVLEKPKGIFRKSCPTCGRRLKRKNSPFLRKAYAYYSCDCGYEYTHTDIHYTEAVPGW